jgi:hypothetical protein
MSLVVLGLIRDPSILFNIQMQKSLRVETGTQEDLKGGVMVNWRVPASPANSPQNSLPHGSLPIRFHVGPLWGIAPSAEEQS